MKKEISLQELYEFIQKLNPGGIQTHEWVDDGQKCRMHTISVGKLKFSTGDAGLEMFLEEVRKQFNK